MAKHYDLRPSEILNIPDEYTAFCFDEACEYIITKLEDGKKPCFIEDEIENKIENRGLQMLLS
jgi:hypothetical protein